MYKNILLPVVFDEGHATDRACDIARALASEDARITVLHVMDAIPGYVLAEIPENILSQTRHEVEAQLLEKARGLPNAQALLVSGKPGRAIVETAKDRDIDCIIMASHKPGIEDLLIGSTADWVVRHARCSTHVIR